ncbi:MAG: radical SAM family heme chaperone HemW [Verrucomicrobia bacterium]|nr:radical SAM family heme chaperone HemW [Verrucomicrobiota bacterium]
MLAAMANVHSLYIHVPFCAHKCEYCAFFSEAANGEVVNRYVAALVRELEIIAPLVRPRTVFFGGGTPSLLNLRQWETILHGMERLNLLGAEEWTVECNPATVSLDKAKLLRDYGVNRISMGVQSLDEQLLDRLGRVHSREMVFKSYEILRKAGFENVNLDLMFAIPTQTMDVWRATLREAIALGSEHLSCYEVIYEEDTPLFHQLQAGEFDVNEELAAAMFDELVATAGAHGFRQYEVANFARDAAEAECRMTNDEWASGPRASAIRHSSFVIPSRACRHNVNYWRAGDCFALGPSATEYIGGVRTKNWSNTQLYCEQLEQGRRATESREELPPLRRAGETAAFGLRMNVGWPFAEFTRVTGFDLRREWAAEMTELATNGLAERDDEGFRLTPRGLRLADFAAEKFLR